MLEIIHISLMIVFLTTFIGSHKIPLMTAYQLAFVSLALAITTFFSFGSISSIIWFLNVILWCYAIGQEKKNIILGREVDYLQRRTAELFSKAAPLLEQLKHLNPYDPEDDEKALNILQQLRDITDELERLGSNAQNTLDENK
jgi:hypothetical protein